MIAVVIDRTGLADFMRRRREALHPADIGVWGGGRRRAVGLRRDEVAVQAQISTDYYSRLEQGRGANPSESVVAGIARALRLDADQRDHLFRLAGRVPPSSGPGLHVRPGLLRLLEHLGDVPALICSDLGDVLHQNALAGVVLGFLDPAPVDARPYPNNLIWSWFTNAETRALFPQEDWVRHSRAHVGDLRATSSRRGGDRDVTRFVADLCSASAEFAELWVQHDVAVHRFDQKRVLHPEVGEIEFDCEVVLTPDTAVHVIAFFPLAGSDAREKLELLTVIGLQSL